ncbi:MAG: heme-degrading domain-containing protein [Chloroflexi bacterium]|nr:heme-degrading domain-containing protein [Chloroflexota bacterium]
MPTSGSNNWPTIDDLETQERDLVLRRADLGSLHRLGRLMSNAAADRELPIVIQIRSGGRLVFVAALPGSTASNDEWAARKARVAQHFEQSSLLVRLLHERDGEDVNSRHTLSPELFQAFGGAFPLRASGVGVIGTVVVSGLPQVDDHAFVVEQLEAHLKTR